MAVIYASCASFKDEAGFWVLVIRPYTKAQKKSERQKALEKPDGPDPVAVQQIADALNRLMDGLNACRL